MNWIEMYWARSTATEEVIVATRALNEEAGLRDLERAAQRRGYPVTEFRRVSKSYAETGKD